MLAPTKTQVHTRWMIRRDLAEALAIENASFDEPWSEEDFLHALRQRNMIGMVAERDDTIYGYCLYELFEHKLRIINLAVDPCKRLQGVGSAILRKLISKLNENRRHRIHFTINERALEAQLCLRSCGFKCVNWKRNDFDNGDSSLLFCYSLT